MADSHRELREQVGAYALGQLSGERWRAVHAHLEVCDRCRADLDEIAPVVGLLGGATGRIDLDGMAGDGGTSAAPPPLPPALLDEVRAAGRARPAAPRRRRTVLVAAAAALALAVGGIGYTAGALSGAGSAPTGESVVVRAVDQDVRASARLVAHTWGMEVKLIATGFAAGETFRVTVTDDVGRTVGAGEFIGTAGEEMRCNLNSSVLRADAASFQVVDPTDQVVLDAAL